MLQPTKHHSRGKKAQDVRAKGQSSKTEKTGQTQQNFLGPSADLSNDSILFDSALPPETEKQISNIMNWRMPRNIIDSDSDEENPVNEVKVKTVAFEETAKSGHRSKKTRRLKGRRSVRPVPEREGDLSAKEQMKRGKAYAAFFKRVDEINESDEDELSVKLSDGLRNWLNYGTTLARNKEVIIYHF